MTNLKRAFLIAFLTVSAWIVVILAIYGAMRIAERIFG
jgi:hypothetical protein